MSAVATPEAPYTSDTAVFCLKFWKPLFSNQNMLPGFFDETTFKTVRKRLRVRANDLSGFPN